MRTFSAQTLAALQSGAVAPESLTASNAPHTVGRKYNLLAYSQDYSDIVWLKSGATITAGQVDPLGGTTAFRVDVSAASLGLYELWNGAVNAGEKYTVSVWLRADSATTIDIGFNGKVNPANNIGDIATIGTSWARHTFTLTAAVDSGLYAIIDATAMAGGATLGSRTAYVWGAQLEPGELAGDYAPTTSTPSTITGTLGNGSVALVQLLKMAFPAPVSLTAANAPNTVGRQYNLLTYSEQFDNAAWGLGLVTITPNAMTAPDGSNTADLAVFSAVANANIQRFIATPVTNGTTFTASVYIYSASATTINLQSFTYPGTQFADEITVNLSVGWNRATHTFTTVGVTTDTGITFYIVTRDAVARTLYLWGAQLEPGEVAGDYALTTSTTRTTAGTLNVPLNSSTWDLVWQRRYNLLTYSNQSAYWSTSDASTASNVATAPDGTLTAQKIIEGATTAEHFATSQTATFDWNTKHCASVYIKAAGRTQVQLRMWGASFFQYLIATFDLTTGTLVGSLAQYFVTDATYKINDSGDGWFRIEISCQSTSGVVGASGMYLWVEPCVSGSGSYAGDGVSGVYFWGAQLEPGEVASTYTPTTTTALTEIGITYKGAYGLGQISPITDKPGEVQGITLELHGADAARISLALDDSDIVQGSPVEVRTALIDTTTYQILDAPVEWVGTMDTMSIAEDGNSATIAVSCESKAVDLLRGNAAMYSAADQRAINATDGSFDYVVDQIDKPIVWPSREFFYR